MKNLEALRCRRIALELAHNTNSAPLSVQSALPTTTSANCASAANLSANPLLINLLRSMTGLAEQVDKSLEELGLQQCATSGKNKQSGKNQTLSAKVVCPVVWPQAALSGAYVTKAVKFEELTLAEFVAGFVTVSITEGISEEDKSNRLNHLIHICYLATRFMWSACLSYHGAVANEIEQGRMRWNSNFQHLESLTLAGNFIPAKHADSSSLPLFCASYQQGNCHQDKDHWGPFRGDERRLYKHMCAVCWLRDKKCARHPEKDIECPHNKVKKN